MIRKSLLHAVAWGVGLLAITAFSNPAASRGRELARGLEMRTTHRSATVFGCAKCEDSDANTHAFDGTGSFFDCSACNACHPDWQSGWCADFHCSCGSQQDDAVATQFSREMLTAESLQRVAALADSRSIQHFVADNPTRVQYNADRHVLQLTACDGSVTAQYPVSDAVATALSH